MSDVGIYDDIEAEILSYVGVPSGVITVASSCSVQDLVTRDGVAKPAIGIMASGERRDGPRAVGQRSYYATTTWHIGIAVNNARGAVKARSTVYGIIEAVRDSLHYKLSARSPSRFLALGVEWPEQQPEGLIVAVAIYELQIILGN